MSFIPTGGYGADPELFFTSHGKIIASEKVIPPGEMIGRKDSVRIVRDGVQAEINLHANPYDCRQSFASVIKYAFDQIKAKFLEIEKKFPGADLGVQINPSVIDVSQDEWDTISPDCKTLGCMPSLNIYDPEASVKVPEEFKMRSAGGHFHLDLGFLSRKFHPDLIKLMDVVVGNTSVLIDRDPRAAERRTVYGRAGEYRLPRYGAEYRTLSNFWLTSYPVCSLVSGLVKIVLGMWYYSGMGNGYHKNPDYTSLLLNQIDQQRVRQAIDANDAALARETFEIVYRFVQKHGASTVLNVNKDYLEHFLEKGLLHWFPQDPLTHWNGIGSCEAAPGWENFLIETVGTSFRKKVA